LPECREVDEGSPVLHDETNGEGEHLAILNCTYLQLISLTYCFCNFSQLFT